MGLPLSGKQSSHHTQRNNHKLTSSGFKQQPICTPLAPTMNKIIYKTACSNGPKRLRSKTASLVAVRDCHRATCFFWPAPCAFRRVAVYWDLLVYHVTIAAPYPGGIDPRLAVYARSWDGHYTTTWRDRLMSKSNRCLRTESSSWIGTLDQKNRWQRQAMTSMARLSLCLADWLEDGWSRGQ